MNDHTNFNYQNIVDRVRDSLQKHLQAYSETILHDICRNEVELLLTDYNMPENMQYIEEDHHNTFSLSVPLDSVLERVLNEEYGISLDVVLPLTEKQKQQLDDKKKGIIRDDKGRIDLIKTCEKQERMKKVYMPERFTLNDIFNKHMDIREKRHLPGKNSINQIVLE